MILKGHQTIIATPDGAAWVNSTGNPGMGTGGTGDVLTGMLAGLTAQYGAEYWEQTLAFGVYLHGLAGDLAYADIGEAPLMAGDLIGCDPARLSAILRRDAAWLSAKWRRHWVRAREIVTHSDEETIGAAAKSARG